MLYGPIHKCLRSALATLSLHAGNTDYADGASFARLEGEFREVIRMLRDHAQNEEDFIHPLYKDVDLPFAELEAKHDEFDQHIAEIERLLGAIDAESSGPQRAATGAQLYRRMNLFISYYFAHLDEEEFRFLPQLMERMPHDRILEAKRRLQAAVQPDDYKLYLKYQIATLNPNERVNVMSEYRRAAPAAFGDFCLIAEAALSQSEWTSLKSRLSA